MTKAIKRRTRKLPPTVAAIKNGKVEWRTKDGVGYKLLGYFLTCHLVIEHYVDECLKTFYPKIKWDAAKLTFANRLALFDLNIEKKFDCLPAIKQMHALRNKISHQLDFELNLITLKPLLDYLKQVNPKWPSRLKTPTQVLDAFVMMSCATLAGAITGRADMIKLTRP